MPDFSEGRFTFDHCTRMCNFFHELFDPVQLFGSFHKHVALQFVGDYDGGDLDVCRFGVYRLQDIISYGPLLFGGRFYREDPVNKDLRFCRKSVALWGWVVLFVSYPLVR